ncbi:hypothetical protein MASR1M66_11540 [Aminivibrio sp.]
MPLFVMNIYNRVIPNRAVESLWVMAIGVGIMLTADFILQLARGYLVDRGGGADKHPSLPGSWRRSPA